jgi:Coenzyme PQQ synthesis protein D (PqqD)
MSAHPQAVYPDPAPRFLLRSKTVVCRQIAGETLVVPIRGKVGDLAYIYSFNETGSALWAALEHPRSLQNLTSLLYESFEVTWDDAQRDAHTFVEEIQAAGLAEVVE